MPWNGSGTYTVPYIWVNDANASIPITASRMDGQDGDIANAFNNCLTRDGQGAPSGNLPMNGFKHTGAAAGVADTDYATMAQLNLKAPSASPALTGVPTAPTPLTTDNSTTIATTAYVKANLANYAQSANTTLTGTTTIANASVTTLTATNATFTNATFNRGYIINGATASSLVPGPGIEVTYRTDLTSGYITSVDRTSGATYMPLVITASTLALSASVSIGGGTSVPKLTISTSAPGTLAVNELWFQRAP